MKRQIIRLTESDLHNIIQNTIKSILRENIEDERHVLKIHKDESSLDEPPMMPPPMDDEPPMDGPNGAPPMDDEPPMDDPNGAPPMDDEPPMDDPNGAPPMDDEPPTDNNTSEIDDIFNNLGVEDQSAVLKYAKSMNNSTDDKQDSPTDIPMEAKRYSQLDYIIEDVLGRSIRGKDRTSKRNSKDITNSTINGQNPFVTHR